MPKCAKVGGILMFSVIIYFLSSLLPLGITLSPRCYSLDFDSVQLRRELIIDCKLISHS